MIANPFDLEAVDNARFITGFEFEIEVAERSAILEAVRKVLGPYTPSRTARAIEGLAQHPGDSDKKAIRESLWAWIVADAIDANKDDCVRPSLTFRLARVA